MMIDKKQIQEQTIGEVLKQLQALGLTLQDDETISLDEKAIRADVLLDTMHFLSDYQENVQVLDNYWREKREQERLKQSFDDGPNL